MNEPAMAQDNNGGQSSRDKEVFSDASAPKAASPAQRNGLQNGSGDGLQVAGAPSSIASVPVNLSPMDQSLQGSQEMDGGGKDP